MTNLSVLVRFLRPALFLCLLSSTFSLLANTETITVNQFRTISSSGKQIASIFEGRAPNDYVRDALILRIEPRRGFILASLNRRDFTRMFKLLLVAEPPTFFSCPTGGICAQPGTTSAPGQFCEDPSGCAVDVHNQTNTSDTSQGTLELFDCEQCCVDWAACTLNNTPPPDPCTGSENQCLGSPIIIDAEGEGFHLTSPETGVTFDISGSGHPVQIAWTDPHFHNAFLALPGSDSLVHNGKELFGNFTPQPASDHPNGFIALAQYDKPENGGNGDGIIDERDTVYSRLRLWIDENHDGVCQPNELHRLPELGVYSLALDYQESRRTDSFGNQFRYKARVNPGERQDSRDQRPHGEQNEVGRWTYDVFFVVK